MVRLPSPIWLAAASTPRHQRNSARGVLLKGGHLDGDTVADVSYDAVGCSISQASTSVMTDLVIGKTIGEAQKLYRGFQEMMRSRGTVELDEDTYEDAIAFEGVAKLMARVKCAMLGWSAARDAILRARAEQS